MSCEQNRPFHPYPEGYQSRPFRRGFNFHTPGSRAAAEYVYTADGFHTDLGSDFALSKKNGMEAWRQRGRGCNSVNRAAKKDLIAVSRFVEDAKAKIIELTQDLDRRHENLEYETKSL